MLRFALRRLYLAIVGLLLLSLPVFAAIRVPLHDKDACDVAPNAVVCDRNPPILLTRSGPLYAIWQTGLPPNDYWPLAIALLAAESAAQVALARRRAEIAPAA